MNLAKRFFTTTISHSRRKSLEQWFGFIFLWLAVIAYMVLGEAGLIICAVIYLAGLVLLFMSYAKYNISAQDEDDSATAGKVSFGSADFVSKARLH